MLADVIKHEVNPGRTVRPLWFIFVQYPTQVVRREALEITLGMLLFLFLMKIYYRILRLIYPLLKVLQPNISRRWHLQIGFFFYEKIIPPSSRLLRGCYELYRKM